VRRCDPVTRERIRTSALALAAVWAEFTMLSLLADMFGLVGGEAQRLMAVDGGRPPTRDGENEVGGSLPDFLASKHVSISVKRRDPTLAVSAP
jgi:hypothetical protein